MKYVKLLPISRAEVEESLASGSQEVIARAIIRMALHETDRLWAEDICLTALSHQSAAVRRAALVGIGHLARLHRRLNLERVIPAIQALSDDPECRGAAEDSMADIMMFVGPADPS